MGGPNLRVKFYPGEVWRCIVHQLDADGMPLAPDLVSTSGPSRESARDAAIEATTDPDVLAILRKH